MEETMTQKRNSLMLIVLVGLLLLFTVVQTVQISALKVRMGGGMVAVAGSAPSVSASAAQRSAPTMVGGC